MFERPSPAVIAMAALLADPVASTLPDIRDGAFWFVQQDGAGNANPGIAQLKARQEECKRINKQLQILKKMQVDQSLLLERQRKLVEQGLKRQTSQTRRRQLQARRQETEETQRRTILQDAQHNDRNLTARRLVQTTTSRNNRRNRQEQSIRKKYPALRSYYKSLTRRTLRAQNERMAAPETTNSSP